MDRFTNRPLSNQTMELSNTNHINWRNSFKMNKTIDLNSTGARSTNKSTNSF